MSSADPKAARTSDATSSLEAMHEEEALGKAYDARLLVRLWKYIRPYVWQVALTLALVFPIFAMEVAPAWIIKTGLDRVAPEGTGEAPASAVERLLEPISWLLEPDFGIELLWWLGGLYLITVLISSTLQFVNVYIMTRTGLSAMRDLRRDVFGHIQSLHLGFFDRYPVGRLVTRATNDIENVQEMFSAGIVALITDVFKMLGFAIVLYLMNPGLALVTFLVVPLLAVAAVVFRFKVRQAYRLVRVRIARINAYIQENVTGMREVQLFTREARNFREFDHMNADHRDAWKRSIGYDSALFSVVELAQNLTVAIIIWKATGVATFGEIYFFFDLLRRFFVPLRDLSAKYSVMQSSMASSERIFQLLDTEPEIVDPVDAISYSASVHGAVRGRVEFDSVWFSYGGENGGETEWVLRDLSFRAEPGEKVAIVGPTGAGKTTIINLLTRLYDVTRGSIRIDGIDLRELRQEDLRRRVAMVLQDVFLFRGSVAENLSLDRPDISRRDVERVARAVQASRFIESLPQGYDTEVRERGSNFSSGQRQLLSFARALAHGADILVLDEATSSIDSETEALIQQGIQVLMEGQTAIAIAHRLSTIQNADRICVLEGGRIVESGDHDQLMAREGAYRRLYQLQIESHEGPAVAAG